MPKAKTDLVLKKVNVSPEQWDWLVRLGVDQQTSASGALRVLIREAMAREVAKIHTPARVEV